MFFKKRNQLRLTKLLEQQERERELDEATGLVHQIGGFTGYASSKHRYLYMSVPKIACTTIKRAVLAFEGYGVVPNIKVSEVHKMGFELKLQSLAHEKVKEIISSDEWYRWCFVRNPYDRLLSAWKSKIRDDETEFRWLKATIHREMGITRVTFRDFIEFLGTTSDPLSLNEAHFRDQTGMLVPDLIPYDKVGRFENFNEDITEILTKLGAPKEVILVGVTKTNFTNYIPLNKIYDQQMADWVYTQCKETFDTFGYDRDSWQ